jgi:hypothetical protein
MKLPSFRIAAVVLATFTSSSFAQSGAAFDRASSFRYPKISFAQASLEDAVGFLARASRDLTADKNGLNIVIKTDKTPTAKITLQLTDIPATEAVRYCAEAAGFSVTWMGNTAVLSATKSVPAPAVAFDGAGRGLFTAASKFILPKIDFQSASTREVLEFLAAKNRLNIVFNAPSSPRPMPPSRVPAEKPEEFSIPGLEPAAPSQPPPPPFLSLGDTRLTFQTTHTSVAETLKIAALLTGASIRWDSNAVVFGPAGTETRPQIVNSVAIKGKVLMEKLAGIEIPKIDLREANLRECCEFLSRKIKELDSERKDVNLLVNGPAAEQLVTLKLDAAPASEVLRYLAELTATDLRIEHHAIVFEAGK